MGIRFGVCTGLENLDAVENAGYDYLEFNVAGIAKMTEEEFLEAVKKVSESKIKVEACNGFFPGEFKLVGDEVDYEGIKAYTEHAMKRAAALGVKVAVVGCGGLRRVPEGYDPDTAYGQFAKVLGICGETAEKYGITIVVEPLRRAETNLINTVAEGIAICKAAGQSNVKCLADFFHVYMNEEGLEAICTSENMICHAHLARANADRCMPTLENEKDVEACKEWANALKECGYQGRISLEGGYGEDFVACIKETRKVLDVFQI